MEKLQEVLRIPEGEGVLGGPLSVPVYPGCYTIGNIVPLECHEPEGFITSMFSIRKPNAVEHQEGGSTELAAMVRELHAGTLSGAWGMVPLRPHDLVEVYAGHQLTQDQEIKLIVSQLCALVTSCHVVLPLHLLEAKDLTATPLLQEVVQLLIWGTLRVSPWSA